MRPTSEEIARVEAWREEQAAQLAEQRQARAVRAPCAIHGAGSGRILYGPAPYGYGPVCRHCRREWSRRNGGRRWESEQQNRDRERAEHAEMVAGVEAMYPAEFYMEWERLRGQRHEATRRYHWHARPDEFGVNHFGCATPDGRRYTAMRERVRREQRAFEEARAVV